MSTATCSTDPTACSNPNLHGAILGVVMLSALFCTNLRAEEQGLVSPLPRPESFRQRVVDLDGLQPWNEIHDAIYALADAYPDLTRVELLGNSAEGRPLLALRVSSDPDDTTRPTVQLVAAHHANEAATPEHVLDAAGTLLSHHQEEPYATWMNQMTLVAVPMVNPDGSHAFWEVDARLGRKNRRVVTDDQQNLGVDLNRNYPFLWDGPEARFTSHNPDSNFFRGPEPASEPEVQAMIGMAERTRPAALLSYHEAATRLLVPYALETAENPAPSSAWAVAEHMLARLPHRFGRRQYRTGRALYPVTGIEKDWYHYRFGTAAFVIELPYRRPRGERLQESIEQSRGAWMALFERWVDGPSLSIRATDAYGDPVEALVSFDEITMRSGERWSTDPTHGWFHYYLPAEGEYTVRLTSDDAHVAVPFVVSNNTKRIEVRLLPSWTLLAEAAH